jgi:hypothetical protein
MADLIVGCSDCHPPSDHHIVLHQCDGDDFFQAINPHGTWMWCHNRNPIKESLKQISQRFYFQTYRNKRDLIRIQQNNPARWNQYCIQLIASLNGTKAPMMARSRGRLVKHLYDWMAHATNLAKGVATEDSYQSSRCQLCDGQETQAHINTTCTHPELIDIRQLQRQKIEEHLLCLLHQSLPHTQRWVRLLIDFAEAHMWEDTEIAGDIWNGRWKRQDIEDVLGTDATMIVSPEDFHLGIQWLTNLQCDYNEHNRHYILLVDR